ncbi:hypothetical protein FACS1894187_16170 [Synergistales bacterium]|nr:hypothetical protein FACS1894187_16170 [Synergistales bacterium]
MENKDDRNNIKPSNIDEVCFEKRDLQVFSIPDVKTKFETVQNYFFPRLEIVLRCALDLVQKIYGVNPYEAMSFVYRPSNSKTAKNNEDFNEAWIGMSGKRDSKRQLKIKRKNGKPYNLHLSSLVLEINSINYSMDVTVQRGDKAKKTL